MAHNSHCYGYGCVSGQYVVLLFFDLLFDLLFDLKIGHIPMFLGNAC